MSDLATFDWPLLLNKGTALLWVAMALLGVFQRCRRLYRLSKIILPAPLAQEDVDYLASVKRSTYLRMGTKIILLMGGLIALFGLMEYVLAWRAGVILMLVLMDAETVSVDAVRRRLALSAQAREDQP